MSIELDAGLGFCEATNGVISIGLITCKFWEVAIEPAHTWVDDFALTSVSESNVPTIP